ncbi:MAG: DUF6101 family protein [Methyloligellaceae bacterium]
MRRQTQPHGLAARWPLCPIDLDPFGLPVRYNLPVDCDADHAREARDLIEITQNSIIVVHEVASAPAVKRTLDLEDFSGVAIRIESLVEVIDGFAISVNLHHPDPKLCFPLYMSYDMNEVGARWQSWGRTLKLPLLLPETDGGWREAVERFGKLKVKPPCQRHSRLMLATRRSDISSVREMGDQSLAHRVTGEELIARN